MTNTPPPTANHARDHLANEYTLLAWSRTGIAIIALGFVVARFGLLIRELGGRVATHVLTGASTVFGVLLVFDGVVLLALSLRRYLRTGQGIEQDTYTWSPWLGLTLTGSLLVGGVLLGVYLVIAN